MSAAANSAHDANVERLRQLFPREPTKSLSLALLQCHDDVNQAAKLLARGAAFQQDVAGVSAPATNSGAPMPAVASRAAAATACGGGHVCQLCQVVLNSENLLSV